MALNLPERRLSSPPMPRRRQIPIDQILKVMGNNPVAQSLPGIGQQLGEALMVAAQRRKQQEQMAALGEELGVPGERFSRLSPEGASILAKSLMHQKEAEAQKVQDQGRIRLFEQQSGVKPGSFGDDFEAAKVMFTQRSIGGRQDKGLDERSDAQFKNRLNNQKNRLINDPRIKPLYAQNIGLKQVGEISNLVRGGNTVAAGALGVKMAKAMGEVGVLTDADVARYVQSGRLDRMAADKLSKWTRGLPSDATQAEIGQIAQVLSDSFSEKIQPIYNEYIDQFSEVEGLTPDEVSKKMAIPYSPTKLQPLPSTGGQGGAWDDAKEKRYQELKRRQMGSQ